MQTGIPLDYWVKEMNVINFTAFMKLHGSGMEKMNRQIAQQGMVKN